LSAFFQIIVTINLNTGKYYNFVHLNLAFAEIIFLTELKLSHNMIRAWVQIALRFTSGNINVQIF